MSNFTFLTEEKCFGDNNELQEMTMDLHKGKEKEEYAEDGVSAYTNIGQMFKQRF